MDPELSEEEEQPLTDIRFRASVRGWNNKTHQSHAQTLLGKTDKQMVTILRNDQDILLIPRKWWPDKTGSLEPEDPGWWYTVTEPVKFRVCEVCTDCNDHLVLRIITGGCTIITYVEVAHCCCFSL